MKHKQKKLLKQAYALSLGGDNILLLIKKALHDIF